MKTNSALPLLFLGMAGCSMLMAQSAGTFTATGSMITPRAAHTATLLPNGLVLIAGGYQGEPDNVFASAELYDPSTGTFTATGNMTTERAFHTAALLSDGRVLIASGIGLSAETYDPSTETFTATRDMAAHPYPGPVITLLQNGKVFIAGYPTAQLYDPVAGTFAATGPYAAPAPAILRTSTLLADGRVLLTGAVNICYQPQCRDPGTGWTELYDPGAGTFSVAGSMNWWNNVYTATLLPSGKVLFAGGDDYNGIPSAAEVFDPSDGTFTAIESPPASLQPIAATLLPDGTVLITGGRVPGGNGNVVAELYMPAGATFSAADKMITARYMHTATVLLDGRVLIAGGFSLGSFSTRCAELYRPAVLVSAPLLFSVSGDGRGQGAIWHAATGQVASANNPAVAGETLSMYTTSLADGNVIPPQVAIGPRLTQVLYFGGAPSYRGYSQVNFRLPNGVTPGPAVPVRMTYLGRPSNEVTIGVR
jgi:hypothetical protein